MKLLSTSDLQTRWGYTRAGIHKLVNSAHFPMPFDIVSNGKIELFREVDIIAYEQDKLWLFDERQKQQRQRLFGLLNLAKANEQERTNILQHAFGSKAKEWTEK